MKGKLSITENTYMTHTVKVTRTKFLILTCSNPTLQNFKAFSPACHTP